MAVLSVFSDVCCCKFEHATLAGRSLAPGHAQGHEGPSALGPSNCMPETLIALCCLEFVQAMGHVMVWTDPCMLSGSVPRKTPKRGDLDAFFLKLYLEQGQGKHGVGCQSTSKIACGSANGDFWKSIGDCLIPFWEIELLKSTPNPKNKAQLTKYKWSSWNPHDVCEKQNQVWGTKSKVWNSGTVCLI